MITNEHIDNRQETNEDVFYFLDYEIDETHQIWKIVTTWLK